MMARKRAAVQNQCSKPRSGYAVHVLQSATDREDVAKPQNPPPKGQPPPAWTQTFVLTALLPIIEV
jgi:hypothetical protein